MKITVTGSLGNISKPLAKKLIKAGHQVTIISSSADKKADIEALGAAAAIGSIADADFLTRAFSSTDAVYTMVPPNFGATDYRKYVSGFTKNYADAIKKAGIPTIGFHLDRYWGLNILDGREDGIGNTPWWQCDFVFTADGGNQERFKARGVRHVWLPPGVVERGVHYGRFRPEFDCDVAFVGSRNYHPEYPFRGELISWLEITYGKRFKLITGVREGDLNDAYASAKVVVGDSCFAGEPYYWSDRVPETVGRGGYLIHPFSEGMHAGYCLPYVGLEHLRQQIEDSLELPEMRRKWVRYQMEIVRQHETYSQRVQTILETVGVVRKSEDREILPTSSDRVHEMRSGSDGT